MKIFPLYLNDEWSMFRHDEAQSGYSLSPAPETNETKWNITAKGGIFQLINKFSSDTIPLLAPGENSIISTEDHYIFGLGKIEIVVTAGIISKKVPGFVFGPFLF